MTFDERHDLEYIAVRMHVDRFDPTATDHHLPPAACAARLQRPRRGSNQTVAHDDARREASHVFDERSSIAHGIPLFSFVSLRRLLRRSEHPPA